MLKLAQLFAINVAWISQRIHALVIYNLMHFNLKIMLRLRWTSKCRSFIKFDIAFIYVEIYFKTFVIEFKIQ